MTDMAEVQRSLMHVLHIRRMQPSGQMDDQTVAMIRLFQRRLQLPVTGRLDAEILRLLEEARRYPWPFCLVHAYRQRIANRQSLIIP